MTTPDKNKLIASNKREPGRPTLNAKIEPKLILDYLNGLPFKSMSGGKIASELGLDYRQTQAVLTEMVRGGVLSKERNAMLMVYKVEPVEK